MLKQRNTIQELLDKRKFIIEQTINLKKALLKIKSALSSIDSYLSHDFFKENFGIQRVYIDQNEKEIDTKTLDQKLWNELISGFGFQDIVSNDRYNEILEQSKNIKFDKLNIQVFIEDVNQNRNVEFNNMLKEVYQNFTSTSYGNWREQKFDNCDKINVNFRCSLYIRFEPYFQKFKVHYNNYRLNNLEKVCFILDSKKAPKYPDTIQDKINKAEEGNLFENEYFEIKLYKNGNQKIKFKRLDILEKLNKYGSGGNYVHAGYKKKYGEKTV